MIFAAGYWIMAIIEIKIAIDRKDYLTLPDNVNILELNAVARG